MSKRNKKMRNKDAAELFMKIYYILNNQTL